LSRSLQALALASLAVACLASAGLPSTKLSNTTEVAAGGVTVHFSERVRISSYDTGIFPGVEPSGRSDKFTFAGGLLCPRASFTIRWSPDSATITGVEWIPEGTMGICSCQVVLEPADSLERAVAGAPAGAIICLRPGRYVIQASIVIRQDLTIRGLPDAGSGAVIAGDPYDERGISAAAGALTIENLAAERGIMFGAWDSATAVVRDCSAWFFSGMDRATLTAERSSFEAVRVIEGAVLSMTDCTLSGGLMPGGVEAHGDAQASITRTTFDGKSTGIYANDNAAVVAIQCIFVGCSHNTFAAGNSRIEVRDE
jgi:hypothetical protein